MESVQPNSPFGIASLFNTIRSNKLFEMVVVLSLIHI